MSVLRASPRWPGAVIGLAVGGVYFAIVTERGLALTRWWVSICLPVPACGNEAWRDYYQSTALSATLSALLALSIAALVGWSIRRHRSETPLPAPRWAAAVAILYALGLLWVRMGL
jgi:hypothetical protein